MSDIIRVFPRRTKWTPNDELAFFDEPPLFDLPDLPVYVSVTFTWDKKKGEILADQWSSQGYDVTIGGPAYDAPGGDFVVGRYLSKGYVFTSRGCNNKCWFCKTWRREGKIRELPIKEGWRVLDSNLLQCSYNHVRAVFNMLALQPMPVSFLGGLEARLLEDWHVDLISEMTIAQCYFAYDTEDDYEPLVEAGKKIFQVFAKSSHRICCYVLIGYRGDTMQAAEKRLRQVIELGFMPFAMLYRDDEGRHDPRWIHFQAQWANPYKIYGKKKTEKMELFNSFTKTERD